MHMTCYTHICEMCMFPAREVVEPSAATSYNHRGIESLTTLPHVLLITLTMLQEAHIDAALGPRYWLVGAKHMFQTRILVYARMDVVPFVTE